MDPSDLNVVLLVATGVLLAGVAAVRISTRAGLPSLLLYLAIGLVLGESGFGVLLEDVDLVQVVGTLALAVILAEGGLTTRWEVIRPAVGLAGALATVGVAISVTVTAGAAYLLLDVDTRTALLLGAVVSSTDAAAVFAVLRTLPLRRRLRATLEAESGFNDPPVIILVTLVTSSAWEASSPLGAGAMMLHQLVVGGVVGLLIAMAGQWVLSRSALPAAGLYPLATMAIALLAFAVGGVAGGSPFLAVYVAGLWLGNADLPHKGNTLGFAEGTAWLAQIGLFVMLGLLASPSRLPEALLPALIVGTALLLVARPLSVVAVATWFRIPWREQAFMSWAGLRGAVPIVLATIPISAGMPAARQVFDVVFLLVVVFTLVQGPTLPWAARWLGVRESDTTVDVEIESAPLEEVDATLLQLRVHGTSKLAGVRISELRLPHGSQVTLVLRDGRPFVPSADTDLRGHDHLLVVTTNAGRRATERRLRAVSRAGRLATWYGERGDVVPDAAAAMLSAAGRKTSVWQTAPHGRQGEPPRGPGADAGAAVPVRPPSAPERGRGGRVPTAAGQRHFTT